MADISVLKLPDNVTYNIKDATARNKLAYTNIVYALCTDAGSTKNKSATITGNSSFELKTGAIVAIRYSATNTFNSTSTDYITMNVGNTGAKPFWYASEAKPTGTNTYVYGIANYVHFYVYDGGNYVYLARSADSGNTYTSAHCTTASGTAAKAATCSNYVLTDNSYLHIIMANNNTNTGALTLNVNNQGAKPIYINGTISSSSNYVLPPGSYIVYYDGENYYFRTDGQLTMPEIWQGDIDIIFTNGSGSSSYSLLPNNPAYFENGIIVDDTGQSGSASTSNRVRTKSYVNLMSNYSTTISASSGYEFWVYKYDGDNNYLGYEPTSSVATYVLPVSLNVNKIRLVIKKSDGGDFNASDVGNTWTITVNTAVS